MSGDGVANSQMSMLEPPEVVADVTYGAGLNRTVGITYHNDDVFNYSTAWDNYLTGSTIRDGGFTYNSVSNRYEMAVHRLVIKKYNVTIERV